MSYTKVKSEVEDIVSCEEFRAFWVSWEKGSIQVGSGTQFTHVLAAWDDPNPLTDTKYVAFGSYEGASVDWQVMHDQGSLSNAL